MITAWQHHTWCLHDRFAKHEKWWLETYCVPLRRSVLFIWSQIISYFLFIFWPKLLIPPSLTLRAWVGFTKTGEKLLLTHGNPWVLCAADYFSVFSLWGKGAQGRKLPWRILCDRSFQFVCLSLCKTWDMRDINTLPRYPCPHPSPIFLSRAASDYTPPASHGPSWRLEVRLSAASASPSMTLIRTSK